MTSPGSILDLIHSPLHKTLAFNPSFSLPSSFFPARLVREREMWRRRISSVLKPAAELCSSSQRQSFVRAPNPSQLVQKPSQTRQFFSHASSASENPISGNVNPGCLYQLSGIYASQLSPCITRSLASASGSEQAGKNQNQTKKDLSTVEDPFDAPTYHIPEKPVTFTEGASYSLVILAGLGIAGAAAYGVFKELIFQPKEYKIFDKALTRVQDDSQVRVRIGTPIKGYGQETRNRAARQKIPNRVWTDEDGVEHVQILFHIRGPHGGGQVRCEMFKDQADNQWKFTYLTVDILSPTPAHLILESFFSS